MSSLAGPSRAPALDLLIKITGDNTASTNSNDSKERDLNVETNSPGLPTINKSNLYSTSIHALLGLGLRILINQASFSSCVRLRLRLRLLEALLKAEVLAGEVLHAGDELVVEPLAVAAGDALAQRCLRPRARLFVHDALGGAGVGPAPLDLPGVALPQRRNELVSAAAFVRMVYDLKDFAEEL
ncbi:hypothetical protein VPH35_140746 [Triticum aestivum]|uniref:Uncharacterized protein n=1 Tax=Aegilops tauschii TaxID=37682 RepID=M8AVZ5_AEGTA